MKKRIRLTFINTLPIHGSEKSFIYNMHTILNYNYISGDNLYSFTWTHTAKDTLADKVETQDVQTLKKNHISKFHLRPLLS